MTLPIWEVKNGKLVVNLHAGQARAWRSQRRFIFMLAGTQSGKTSYGPIWLRREIQRCGPGDYLAVTSTFPLLKLKMLPEFLRLFQHTLHLGEWKAADKVFEFYDGQTRVIFGSATNAESLESATAKAAWIDECVAPETMIETEIGRLPISEIVNRRLNVRVWSLDTTTGRWALKPIVRWIRNPQRRLLRKLGSLQLTGNHKVWTQHGYKALDDIAPALYNTYKAGADNVYCVRELPDRSPRSWPETLLQRTVCCAGKGAQPRLSATASRVITRSLRQRRTTAGNIEAYARTIRRSVEKTMASTEHSSTYAELGTSGRRCSDDQQSVMGKRGQWSSSKLATGKACSGARVGKRVCCGDWEWPQANSLQGRRSRTCAEGRYRGGQRSEHSQASMVRGEWVDISSLLQPDGRDMDGRLSSDGYVYNITVKDNHNYVADDLLIANCGQDQFRLESWEAIQRRLSLHQGRVLGGTTIYNLGWLKQQAYDRWQAGDEDYHVIQFRSTENPAFPKAEYERAKRTLPAWKFNMMYGGEYDRPAGLIYADYLDHYREQGGHLVKPFSIPPEWPRHAGIDFGAVNTALIWLAHDPAANVYYAYRESLEGGKSTRQHVADAIAAAQGLNMRTWHGGAKSEVQQRMDWQQEGIYVQEPPVSDVESGIDKVIELLKTFRLFVFDTMVGLRDELGTYSREVDDSGQPTEKIKSKEHFHRLDAARYVVLGTQSGIPSWWLAAKGAA